MAASLSSDGCIWGWCIRCRQPIYRFPGGQIWRTPEKDSNCKESPLKIHVPER